MNLTNKRNIFVVVGLIVLGAISRFLPHPPNVTAITAIALLGATYIGKKNLAILLPIGILFCSDFIINNTIARPFFPDNEGLVFFESYMIYTYLAFILVGFLGFYVRKNKKAINLLPITLIATIIFFALSNFGVWAQGILYPQTMGGLIACFAAAVPYFFNSLLGNLFFVGVLFAAYQLIMAREKTKILA